MSINYRICLRIPISKLSYFQTCILDFYMISAPLIFSALLISCSHFSYCMLISNPFQFPFLKPGATTLWTLINIIHTCIWFKHYSCCVSCTETAFQVIRLFRHKNHLYIFKTSSFVCSRVDVDVLALLDSVCRAAISRERRRSGSDVTNIGRIVPHEQELEQPAAQHAAAQRQHSFDRALRRRTTSLLPTLQHSQLSKSLFYVERYTYALYCLFSSCLIVSLVTWSVLENLLFSLACKRAANFRYSIIKRS